MKYSGIGGQAVMEGIMMRNGDRYSVGVRRPDGEIEVKVEPYRGVMTNHTLMKIPIIRGVAAFVDSLVIGIRSLMYSATFYDDEEEEKKKAESMTREEKEAYDAKKAREDQAFLTGTLVFSIVLAVAVFMVLPYFLTTLLERAGSTRRVLNLFESVVRVVIFLGYLFLVSRAKDIQRTFEYHGAEHKCINCIEHGLELNVENVMKSSREHKRCGTSFLFFVIIVSAVFLMFIQTDSHVLRIVYRILLVPVIAGVSYEMIRLAGKSDNRFVNLLSMPGLALQRLTTKEPDESEAEVAISAVEAVFDWKAWQAENLT